MKKEKSNSFFPIFFRLLLFVFDDYALFSSIGLTLISAALFSFFVQGPLSFFIF
jgi:hypothetical protein